MQKTITAKYKHESFPTFNLWRELWRELESIKDEGNGKKG